MPLYDRACTAEECGWRALDIWEHVSMPLVVCPDCGAPTARAWLTKAAAVIPDKVHIEQVNGLRHPRVFESRLEHQRWLKENNFRVKDTHVGDQGSDKSKYTTSANIMDPQTMANAIFLVTHRAMIDAAEVEEPLNITFREGTLSKAEARMYRKRNERRDRQPSRESAPITVRPPRNVLDEVFK